MSLRETFCATKQPPVEEFHPHKWRLLTALPKIHRDDVARGADLQRHVIDLSTYLEKTVAFKNKKVR